MIFHKSIEYIIEFVVYVVGLDRLSVGESFARCEKMERSDIEHIPPPHRVEFGSRNQANYTLGGSGPSRITEASSVIIEHFVVFRIGVCC